jgi:pyruvate dehydrogenase E1 component
VTPALHQAIVDGAYWLRTPGPNCEVVVAYMGAVVPVRRPGFLGNPQWPPRRHA